MWLPGRLEFSTLGDLLGRLHRTRCSGRLELVSVGGPAAGTAHAIHLEEGLIVRVDGPGPRLGERLATSAGVRARIEHLLASAGPDEVDLTGAVLARAGLAPPAKIVETLSTQASERLEALFALPRAEVRFRVHRADGRRSGAPTLALPPAVFLHGRPRTRDRSRTGARGASPPCTSAPVGDARAGVADASTWAALGLDAATAGPEDLRRAFRRRAAALHPDRARDATVRRVLGRALADLTAAYHRALAVHAARSGDPVSGSSCVPAAGSVRPTAR